MFGPPLIPNPCKALTDYAPAAPAARPGSSGRPPPRYCRPARLKHPTHPTAVLLPQPVAVPHLAARLPRRCGPPSEIFPQTRFSTAQVAFPRCGSCMDPHLGLKGYSTALARPGEVPACRPGFRSILAGCVAVWICLSMRIRSMMTARAGRPDVRFRPLSARKWLAGLSGQELRRFPRPDFGMVQHRPF